MNMRENRSWLFLAATLLVASATSGCKSDEAKGTDPAPKSSVQSFGVPLSTNKCPSAALGAKTTVQETADGVEITVIAPDGPPINDIRQRGAQLIAAMKDPSSGTAADGLASCPIIVKDTLVTETDVPGGARFNVKPVQALQLDGLKRDVKLRASSYVAPK